MWSHEKFRRDDGKEHARGAMTPACLATALRCSFATAMRMSMAAWYCCSALSLFRASTAHHRLSRLHHVNSWQWRFVPVTQTRSAVESTKVRLAPARATCCFTAAMLSPIAAETYGRFKANKALQGAVSCVWRLTIGCLATMHGVTQLCARHHAAETGDRKGYHAGSR
jgi:hypothetical protein